MAKTIAELMGDVTSYVPDANEPSDGYVQPHHEWHEGIRQWVQVQQGIDNWTIYMRKYFRYHKD